MAVLTPRLRLAALTREEWAAVAAGARAAWAPDYPTGGDLVAAGLVVAGDWPAGDWGPRQIRLRSGDVAIGGIGCKGAPDDDGRVEIGYGLVPSARGLGYATEAVLGLIEWLRHQGVREVVAECDVDNSPSMAVLRRSGFAESADDRVATWWVRRLNRG